jgi:hypothetical protein
MNENKLIEMKMKRAREIQEKIVDIFKSRNVDGAEGYAILTDLCYSWKKYLKEEQDADEELDFLDKQYSESSPKAYKEGKK